MKTILRTVALATATLALTPAAYAQSYDQQLAELTAKFKEADKNGDGKLTQKEAKDAGMTRLASNFNRVDTDKDGFVTFAQLKSRLDARYK